MKEHGLIALSIFVLSACHAPSNQPADQQAGMSARVEAVEAFGMARLCAIPVERRPVWWQDGSTGTHFGCATAYNAAMQNMPHRPAPATGTDSTLAVSGVLRYRRGEVEPLREPSVEVGASRSGR